MHPSERGFRQSMSKNVGILDTDMEKGVDTRTLSAEIFENCRNFLIVEDYAPLFSEENLFLVEMFDETFNIWHIYNL